MFFEILLAIIIGVNAGIITGLTPGIHVNLVAIVLVGMVPTLGLVPVNAAMIIISCALTHTFIDSIPSIYLGAPDADQALGALPGHRLLLQGLGHHAVLCTIYGSLSTLILSVLFFPFFVQSMRFIYPIIEEHIEYILMAVLVFMVMREKHKIKVISLILAAGLTGMLVFELPLANPLFHMLSGLFGVSILAVSLAEKAKIPLQSEEEFYLEKGKKAVTAATGVGFCAAFLPGLGSSQAAIMAQNIVGDIGDKGFLTLVGGINTANMVLSLSSAYVLDKARNGAIIGVRELIGQVSFEYLLLFLSVILIVGGMAAILASYLSKVFSYLIQKIDYATVVIGVITIILTLSWWFDGLLGLIVLLHGTALGILATKEEIGKHHLMGCLLIPVIFYLS
ncbi:MAG: tripartite tricarboxylate transporter permease [Candidatus Woesearchaeota archaeon]